MPATRSTAALLVLCVPLSACSRRTPDKSAPPEEILLIADDHRPSAGLADNGDDVTELARAQNAPGKQPPYPRRHGRASPTRRHPRIRTTDTGFIATIPDAASVVTPAHHRGNVLVGGFHGTTLHAVHAGTGKPAWSLHLSDDGPTDPTCKDGVCVINTFSCTTFGVDAETGKPLWSWYLGAPQLATPVISGEIVYTSYPDNNREGDADHVLGAFDLRTGKPLWRRWIDSEVASTPVVAGGEVLLATQAGTLYRFNAADGEILSARHNFIASPPVVLAGIAVYGRGEQPAENDMLRTSAPIFPELEPARDTNNDHVTPKPRPLLADHRLITVDDGIVTATDRKTGRRLWQHRFGDDAPAALSAPLLHAGPAILLATAAGNVMRIEPETGNVDKVFRLAAGQLSSPPIAVDGWLYAGTADGTMVAFDTGEPALTGWEMLGGGPDRRGTLNPEET
ncbi:MAG: PQQ-binding-like beta-propeller repeat protein [Polyangiaceae bacterium]